MECSFLNFKNFDINAIKRKCCTIFWNLPNFFKVKNNNTKNSLKCAIRAIGTM